MKYIYNYDKYSLIENYKKQIEECETIDELKFLCESSMNEGIFHSIKNFIQDKVKKIKDFFSGGNDLLNYLSNGEEVKRDLEEHILLIYHEPIKNQDYIIYDGDDATNTKLYFNQVFATYNLPNKFIGNFKKIGPIRVTRIETDNDVEYIIGILSFLDDLEVSRDLYDKGGFIEKETPSVIAVS